MQRKNHTIREIKVKIRNSPEILTGGLIKLARQNTVFLLGQVYKEPKLKAAEDGGYAYAMCYVDVVR